MNIGPYTLALNRITFITGARDKAECWPGRWPRPINLWRPRLIQITAGGLGSGTFDIGWYFNFLSFL